jgi:hypothetical protein
MQQQQEQTTEEDRPWLRMESPDRIRLFNEYATTLPDRLTTRQVQAAMLKRFPIW